MVPMLAVNALLAKKGGGNTQASSTQIDPQTAQQLLQGYQQVSQENEQLRAQVNKLLQQQQEGGK